MTPITDDSRRSACAETVVTRVSSLSRPGREHGLYKLTLANPGIGSFAPGQFMMLRPKAFGLDPLWARPFSIFDLTRTTIVFFIQTAGRGTAILAGLESGAEVTLWGPLGNAFVVEPDTPTLILAGGVGIAPFYAYAKNHPNPAGLSLLFGHRPPVSAYPFKDIAAFAQAEHRQERKPADLTAFVALLEERMKANAAGLTLACGPHPFLLTVKRLARKHRARLQLSLENRMACGVGACLGCVTKMKTGDGGAENAFSNVQVCTKGPVFWAHDIRLDGEEPWT